MTPVASRSVDCWSNRNPSSTLGERLNPRRAPQEKASFGPTWIGDSSIVPTLTPSLNVQPAVPLISTRGSCADTVAAPSATSIAVRIVLRIIVFLSFFMTLGGVALT